MKKTETVGVEGVAFDNAMEAAEYAEATGQESILFAGKKLVVAKAEVERLIASEFSFAYLELVKYDDGDVDVVTVPVN